MFDNYANVFIYCDSSNYSTFGFIVTKIKVEKGT